MWEVWEAPAVMTAFGTLLAGTAACVGVFVAAIGLNSWKRERNSDCAKRLATVAYGHRLALIQILYPWRTLEEDDQFEPVMTEVTSQILRQRWAQSRQKLDEVNACLAEADLRWQGKATEAYKSVFEHEFSLFRDIGQLSWVERKLVDLEARQRLSGDYDGEAQKKREEYWAKETRLKDKLTDTFDENKGSREEVYRAFKPIHELLEKKL